jgi:hypothetical protein
MPPKIVRCTGCGRVMSSDPRATERARNGPHDPEADDLDVGCFDICTVCIARIDARFRRPNAGREGTLAEVLVLHYEAFKAALHESTDSDLREVLPNLPRELLPQRRRWRRQAERIEAILARIGKPVCWYDPDLVREGEGPFWLFHLHPETGQICHTTIDHFDVAELRDHINALDYDRAGNPLNAIRKASPAAPPPRSPWP